MKVISSPGCSSFCNSLRTRSALFDDCAHPRATRLNSVSSQQSPHQPAIHRVKSRCSACASSSCSSSLDASSTLVAILGAYLAPPVQTAHVDLIVRNPVARVSINFAGHEKAQEVITVSRRKVKSAPAKFFCPATTNGLKQRQHGSGKMRWKNCLTAREPPEEGGVRNVHQRQAKEVARSFWSWVLRCERRAARSRDILKSTLAASGEWSDINS